MTRARPIRGPLQESYIDIAQKIWRDVGRQPDLFGKIDEMLGRIRRERGSGSDQVDFKTGAGGMIEAEFLVQALQMRSGIPEPNWKRAIALLREKNVISEPDANKTTQSYELLRRCETALRRLEDKTVSTLPATSEEQLKLAKRLGYKDAERFIDEYRAAREIIHQLYNQYLKAS